MAFPVDPSSVSQAAASQLSQYLTMPQMTAPAPDVSVMAGYNPQAPAPTPSAIASPMHMPVPGEAGVAAVGGYPQAPVPQLGVPQGAVPTDDQGNPQPSHTQRDAVNGPFKTHGVAGDILGHLMDAFLVSAGLPAEYGPRVAQAKIADALGPDFVNNPQAAVARAQAAGQGGLAQTLENTGIENRGKVITQNEQQVNTQNAAQSQPFKMIDLKQKAAAPFYALAYRAGNDPKTVAGTAATIRAGLLRQQIDPKELNFPADAETNPQALKQWALSAASVGSQYTADNTNTYHQGVLANQGRGLDIRQQATDQSGRLIDSEVPLNAARADQASAGAANATARTADLNAQAPSKKDLAQARVDYLKARTGKLSGASSAPSVPTLPPRRVGDAIVSSSGVHWVSPDGKSWKQSK